jgi:hypothetical protein
LILDGTVDLTLDGFEFYSQESQAFNDTLVSTLDACTDDPSCRGDMNGGGVIAFDNLTALLKNGPASFRFPLPGGESERRNFTFAHLEVAAAGQMYNEGDRMMFNRAMAAYASRGDLAPLARLVYLSLGMDPETLEAIPDLSYSDAIYYGVECQDYGYPGGSPGEKAENYLRAGDPVEAAIARLASIFYGDLPCAYWPDATSNLARPEPLVAEGVRTLVLGATADPATPVGNGISVYQHLDDAYLITQQGGPHIIFGRGNACPDDLVTDFLVLGQVPEERETECEGVIVDAYVPLAPTDASDFENPLEALSSAENEITYLPEYYYWDGIQPTGTGCTFGGTLHFELEDPAYSFELSRCALTRNFSMTGKGSYDPDEDRFVLVVDTAGRWQCTLKYIRTGEITKVTGFCGDRKVAWEE